MVLVYTSFSQRDYLGSTRPTWLLETWRYIKHMVKDSLLETWGSLLNGVSIYKFQSEGQLGER